MAGLGGVKDNEKKKIAASIRQCKTYISNHCVQLLSMNGRR